jgi:plasmid stabilization system protein ParE
VTRRFVLTPDARNDLAEILGEVADDSADAAEKLREEFLEAFRTLGRTPGIGHYHDELLSREYRFWNVQRFVVAYRWKVRPIQIARVAHGSRELGAYLSAEPSGRA